MSKRAGGAAQAGKAPYIEDEAEARNTMLTEELETARVACVEAAARLSLLCKVRGTDPAQLADVADAASLAAGRVAGFARLLARHT